MEKLLELLQIYIIERQGREEFKLYGDKIILWRPYKFRKFPQYDTNAIIISKRFGFIQRLIENDKIDRKKYDRVYINTKESGILGLKDYEQLLMLLSISEKPIDFLISVLK